MGGHQPKLGAFHQEIVELLLEGGGRRLAGLEEFGTAWVSEQRLLAEWVGRMSQWILFSKAQQLEIIEDAV